MRDVVLPDEIPRGRGEGPVREFTRNVAQHLLERLELLGFPFALVQHLSEALELRQSQLQRHSVRVSVRRVLEQVLRVKDNL